MPITVSHQPNASLTGQVALASGQGDYGKWAAQQIEQNRQFNQSSQIQLLGLQNTRDIATANLNQDAAQFEANYIRDAEKFNANYRLNAYNAEAQRQFAAQQAYQQRVAAERQALFGHQSRMAQQAMGYNADLYKQQQAANAQAGILGQKQAYDLQQQQYSQQLAQENYEFQLSAQQKQQKSKLEAEMAAIQQAANNGTLTPQAAQSAIQQKQAQLFNIQPTPQNRQWTQQDLQKRFEDSIVWYEDQSVGTRQPFQMNTEGEWQVVRGFKAPEPAAVQQQTAAQERMRLETEQEAVQFEREKQRLELESQRNDMALRLMERAVRPGPDGSNMPMYNTLGEARVALGYRPTPAPATIPAAGPSRILAPQQQQPVGPGMPGLPNEPQQLPDQVGVAQGMQGQPQGQQQNWSPMFELTVIGSQSRDPQVKRAASDAAQLMVKYGEDTTNWPPEAKARFVEDVTLIEKQGAR